MLKRSQYFSLVLFIFILIGTAGTAFSATPVISGVSFNLISGTLKIGDTLTVTITADADGYAAGPIIINHQTIDTTIPGNFNDSGGGIYTVTYRVSAGDANVAQTSQIPISIVLTDTATNESNDPGYTALLSPSADLSPAIDGRLADTTAEVPGLNLSGVAGVATDSFGNLYIADTVNNKVIIATKAVVNGVISYTLTYVGSPIGKAGFAPSIGSTGLNTTLADLNILFDAPAGVAVDANGNVYIADTGNNRIHMIAADPATKLISGATSPKPSQIITVAGNGTGGFSGDSAVAIVASLKRPTGVAIDASGNIYIADNGNYRIRKELALKSTTNNTTGFTTYTPGIISTIAGDGTATKLTAFGLAFSPAPVGDLYIADAGNNRILKIVANKGVIDGKSAPISVVGTVAPGFSGDSGLASRAQLNQPSAVATDGKDLYIADTMNNCVRVVSLSTGVISTLLGTVDKSPAIIAPSGFVSPVSIAVDAAGTVYVEDTGNRKIQQVFASVSAITTASPPGGTYAAAQNVVLTSSKAARIMYSTSTDAGTTYSTYSTYSTPILISANTILKFYSIDVAGDVEVINTATYTFVTTVPTTTASINATPFNGVYSSASVLAVTLTSNDAKNTIYYTTTGTAPTTASAKYTAPISISKTTTVKYFAVDPYGNKEPVKTVTYTVDTAAAPTTTASVLSGTYASIQSVKLTVAPADAATNIYYTTDGSIPTTSSTRYTAPILISNSTTLQYFAKDKFSNLESVKTQQYIINTLTTTASPQSGVFYSPQTVVLSSNGVGAIIYYTVDGSTPGTTNKNTSTYSQPILMQNSRAILQFFAVDGKGIIENVKSETYTTDSVPPTSVATCGTTENTITLTATDDTDLLPKIMYSISDSVTHTGTPFAYYTAPIPFTLYTIVKFFAVDAAGNTEKMHTDYCATVVAPFDTNPALYLETFTDNATTANSTFYVTGNVAPFSSVSSLTINTNAPASSSPADGSFIYSESLPLSPATQSIIVTATAGAAVTSDARTISVDSEPNNATGTSLSIGSSNGVIGHSVRVPISLISGYQAAAVSIDITYNPAILSNPGVKFAKAAAALGKSIQGNILSAGIYRILIMEANSSTALAPLPDGEIAYLSFTITQSQSTHPGVQPLQIDKYSVTDLGRNLMRPMPINAVTNGTTTIVAKPGDTFDIDLGNVPVTLKRVQDALYMLLDPITNTVDGAFDLNADGTVQINELQKVINSFIGL